jgi:hypothetical protein
MSKDTRLFIAVSAPSARSYMHVDEAECRLRSRHFSQAYIASTKKLALSGPAFWRLFKTHLKGFVFSRWCRTCD